MVWFFVIVEWWDEFRRVSFFLFLYSDWRVVFYDCGVCFGMYEFVLNKNLVYVLKSIIKGSYRS